MQPENKACIITGGSRHIGKVIALAFAGDRTNPVSTFKAHPAHKSTRKETMDSSEQFSLINGAGKAIKNRGK
jgi:NAD(P)-dependent dehydrogenase (short-subunit alcohol dehydrogenase family)